MITEAQADGVRALLDEGLSLHEVARRTGASYGYVRNQALRMGRKMTRSHPNAPNHVWRTSPIGWPRREEQP